MSSYGGAVTATATRGRRTLGLCHHLGLILTTGILRQRIVAHLQSGLSGLTGKDDDLEVALKDNERFREDADDYIAGSISGDVNS